jgi:hypothetical protein
MAGGGAGAEEIQNAEMSSFVGALEDAFGFNRNVVRAWIQSEGANPANNNPLNIMVNGQPAKYASLAAGAAATVQFLRGSNYTAVRTAAKTGTPEEQIQAIAASPFDSTGTTAHYTNDGKPGDILLGIYHELGGNRSVTDTVNAVDPASIVSGAVSGVESWAESAGLRGLLYLTFTLLALGLVFVALRGATSGVRANASAASNAVGALGPLGKAGAEAIPF